MNNTLINLLLNKKFTTLSLTLCLILGNYLNIEEGFNNLCDKTNIDRLYEKIKELNSNGTLNINDRQLSREFNRSSIKKELLHLESLELIYLDSIKCSDTSSILETQNIAIKSGFWKLYLNGNSSTRNILKFILSQVVVNYNQEVHISTALLLDWLKNSTAIKSVTGRDYTQSIKILTDSNFLSATSKNKYIINSEFISPKN